VRAVVEAKMDSFFDLAMAGIGVCACRHPAYGRIVVDAGRGAAGHAVDRGFWLRLRRRWVRHPHFPT
jgi:hypothetical protein